MLMHSYIFPISSLAKATFFVVCDLLTFLLCAHSLVSPHFAWFPFFVGSTIWITNNCSAGFKENVFSTHIHTYIHTCMHPSIHPSMHACMHACMHAYILYIYYIYIYTYTYLIVFTYNIFCHVSPYVKSYDVSSVFCLDSSPFVFSTLASLQQESLWSFSSLEIPSQPPGVVVQRRGNGPNWWVIWWESHGNSAILYTGNSLGS